MSYYQSELLELSLELELSDQLDELSELLDQLELDLIELSSSHELDLLGAGVSSHELLRDGAGVSSQVLERLGISRVVSRMIVVSCE